MNEMVIRFAHAQRETIGVPPPCYRSFAVVRAGSYRIADAYHTTLEDPGRDAAMTAHRIVAARPQVFLHSQAGLALPCAFEHGLADTKTAVLECRETDTGDDQVAAQQRGIDGVEPRQRGDGAEMFLLNEGDLALASAARGTGRRPIQTTWPLRGKRARRSARVVSSSSMYGCLPCDSSRARNISPEILSGSAQRLDWGDLVLFKKPECPFFHRAWLMSSRSGTAGCPPEYSSLMPVFRS